MKPRDISVVIPTYREQDNVSACVASALEAGASEVIVSDGGSDDATIERASQAGATHAIRSLPGRGIQQNAGSTFCTGDAILFLHADSRIHASVLRQIGELDEDWIWGAVRQNIDAAGIGFRLLEIGNAARVRWWKMAFGDQAIFVRRDVFKKVGGFQESPLMEDVELSRELRRLSRPRLIDGPVFVSARRWKQRGLIRQTLLNWKIQVAHKLGARPETLSRWYR